ncbi:MAG: hypothetical protein KAS63_04350 [Candidatus Heimdallarchaeota archaeon]|nr:hypothetical protein [Candidatus Heimdallarchaeota archaeon]MCK4954566.1 hypothetical protein [Candidatus Heimdallarchaeota archaeon]
MDYWYFFIIGGILLIASILMIYFRLKKRKKEEHPLAVRTREMIVMINQRIHSLNNRIKKLDSEITELMIVMEKNDLSFTTLQITLENIPTKIDENKEEIRISISDIEDLRDYQSELEQKIKEKEENKWESIEKLLDFAKEKMRYRYT